MRIFTILSSPDAAARFAVTVLFAVVFLQSSLDKMFDRDGNLTWLNDHFQKSPLASSVPLLLTLLTVLEFAAGVFCAIGVVFSDFSRTGWTVAAIGILFADGALLALMVGQRIAKDYAGAAVVAAYFAAGLVGLALF
jgi:hypothetical protein